MKLKDIFKKVWCGIKTTWQFLDDRKRWRRVEDWSVYKICGGLLIAFFILGVCLLISFIGELATGNWHIDFSIEGIKNIQIFWQQYSSLIKAFFYVITLLIAGHTLIKYIDVETCRSIGEIRTKLNETPKKIISDSLLDPDYRKSLQDHVNKYFKAHPQYENEVGLSAVEMLDYLGTLELGALMLQRCLITNQEFFDQFGYRYVYLSRSPIMDMLNEEKDYYEPLFYAMSVAVKINEDIKNKEAKAQKSKPSAVKSDSSLANNEG